MNVYWKPEKEALGYIGGVGCGANAPIKDSTAGSLNAWIMDALPPGGFLYAVLTNDLKGAIGRADSHNLISLYSIVDWLYNYAPYNCWGSESRVAEWGKTGGINGMNKPLEEAEEVDAEAIVKGIYAHDSSRTEG